MGLNNSFKNILIIYPHWYPSHLVGVHRPRLIGNFLPEFGWHPIILTVKEEFFEEKPDYDFKRTFREHYEIHRVNAFEISRIRLVGDIGIRAFFQLYYQAKKIIKTKKIDFIWIPIPSYYTSILGRLLHKKFKIPYGIDYIDPWVRSMSNYPYHGIRQRLSLFGARILEPIAVKKASLISGVSKAYYASVLERNKYKNLKLDVYMPMGFDPKDHEINLNIETPWSHIKEVRPFIYAGAFLPNSTQFIKSFFKSISYLRENLEWDEKIKLFFVGTGNYPGITIKEIACQYGLKDTVIEIQDRFPYLVTLNLLEKSEGVLVIGSPSSHYTASKIFQAILSKNPVFAFFHEKSTVVDILKEVNADQYLMKYNNLVDDNNLNDRLNILLKAYFNKEKDWNPNLNLLEKYSAKESTRVLVNGINKCLNLN